MLVISFVFFVNSLNEQQTGTAGQNEEVQIEMAVMSTDAVDLKKRDFYITALMTMGLDGAAFDERAQEIEQEVEYIHSAVLLLR